MLGWAGLGWAVYCLHNGWIVCLDTKYTSYAHSLSQQQLPVASLIYQVLGCGMLAIGHFVHRKSCATAAARLDITDKKLWA